jgi:hypothetical protein
MTRAWAQRQPLGQSMAVMSYLHVVLDTVVNVSLHIAGSLSSTVDETAWR